ncbi:hypothetical protein K438DRAFT_1961969 [Mycena galopus ATCC 62051]|nr:hypothetical protein K438DRAFT_1961969 [Mycena galopus ATCC 62051]
MSDLLSPPEAEPSLRNNDPPLEIHIPSMRNFVPTAQNRLGVLHAERDALRAKEVAVEQAIATLEGYINDQKFVLSPVRRIPADIMCKIFRWTLPHNRMADTRFIPQRHDCLRMFAAAGGTLLEGIQIFGPVSVSTLGVAMRSRRVILRPP